MKRKSENITDTVSLIAIAGRTHWQAAAWWLERRLPAESGRKDVVAAQLSGSGGGPIPTQISPDQPYDHVWTRTMMHRARQHLGAEFAGTGKVRELVELSPFLSSSADPGEYAEAGSKTPDCCSASHCAAHTVRPGT